MSTCTRPGCRKKATYRLSLFPVDGLSPIQVWRLCAEDRDAVQRAVADATAPRIKELAGMAKVKFAVPPELAGDPLGTLLATQAMLDKEDSDLRDQVAHSETSSEEPKDATPERTLLGGLAKRGRAVARPTATEQALD